MRSQGEPTHRGSTRAHRYKGQLHRAKSLRLPQLWPQAQALPLNPRVHMFNYCYLGLTVSGHHFSTPVLLTPISTSVLHSQPYSGPCHHGELLPLWNVNCEFPILTTSYVFLLCHSPSSITVSVFIHFVKASSYLVLLCFFPFRSVLSSLQLGPHDLHVNASLFPWLSTTFQTDWTPNLSKFSLFFFSYSQSFFGPTTKSQNIFGKIITKSCALVPIYSHVVMMSSLHWVSHMTCP